VNLDVVWFHFCLSSRDLTGCQKAGQGGALREPVRFCCSPCCKL
jgi:hypothetical protein